MNEFKTIISFTYPHEAHLAKGYLESNGIETFIENEFTVQANNFYSNAIGGVKLLVKDSDYDEGLKLLKDVGYIKEPESEKNLKRNLLNKTEIVQIDSKINEKTCPFCKSENIGKSKNFSIFMIPLFYILGGLFPIYRSAYICFDCGKEWRWKIVPLSRIK